MERFSEILTLGEMLSTKYIRFNEFKELQIEHKKLINLHWQITNVCIDEYFESHVNELVLKQKYRLEFIVKMLEDLADGYRTLLGMYDLDRILQEKEVKKLLDAYDKDNHPDLMG